MKKNNSVYLSCVEAGELTGFSAAHIRRLVNTGQIEGQKIGRTWIINKDELKHVYRRRIDKKKDNSIYGIGE